MKLKKNNYELDEYFKLRKKFIELFKTNNKKDFIYVENLSLYLLIWYF